MNTLEVLPPTTDVSALRDADANKPALWESERAKVEKFTASVTAILAPSDNPELQAKLARTTRLEIRPVRIEVEKMRKAFNEDSQAKIKACNSLAKQITEACEQMETKLLEVEQYAERAEAARLAALTEERTQALQAAGSMVPVGVGRLDEKEFTALLEDAKELQRLKLEREQKAEEARLAAMEADRLERIRIEEDNARLQAEAVERDRLAKIEAEKVAAERAEEQRLARIESERREAEFAKEREALEAKAKAEREKADALQKELQAKAEAEAATKLAEKKAAEKAAKAPDSEKIALLLGAIKALPVPEMGTPEGKAAVLKIRTALNTAYAQIKAIQAQF